MQCKKNGEVRGRGFNLQNCAGTLTGFNATKSSTKLQTTKLYLYS